MRGTTRARHSTAGTSGVRNLGVAEGGVGYAIDQNNRNVITPEMEKRLEQARADIVAGKIKVTDYTAK